MLLGREKTQKFYDLLSGLAEYVNKKLKITTVELGDFMEGSEAESAARAEVVNAVWTHPELIDKYLRAEGAHLSETDQAIIAGWKRCVPGNFVVERSLKGGGVLFGDNNEIYLVQNFMSSWEDLAAMSGLRLPCFIRTCLLPYEGKIVADGLIAFYQISLGPGIKKSLKEEYNKARAAGKIHKTL